ncbi:hypothetical protein BDZ91DRAFT_718243 [Kalaharituber pfeilii]|nr:hypothetical protein BDZ91DRAFT_718243 [Kalaharituber pfeilii]
MSFAPAVCPSRTEYKGTRALLNCLNIAQHRNRFFKLRRLGWRPNLPLHDSKTCLLVLLLTATTACPHRPVIAPLVFAPSAWCNEHRWPIIYLTSMQSSDEPV